MSSSPSSASRGPNLFPERLLHIMQTRVDMETEEAVFEEQLPKSRDRDPGAVANLCVGVYIQCQLRRQTLEDAAFKSDIVALTQSNISTPAAECENILKKIHALQGRVEQVAQNVAPQHIAAAFQDPVIQEGFSQMPQGMLDGFKMKLLAGRAVPMQTTASSAPAASSLSLEAPRLPAPQLMQPPLPKNAANSALASFSLTDAPASSASASLAARRNPLEYPDSDGEDENSTLPSLSSTAAAAASSSAAHQDPQDPLEYPDSDDDKPARPKHVDMDGKYRDQVPSSASSAAAPTLPVSSLHSVKSNLNDEDGVLIWHLDPQRAHGKPGVAHIELSNKGTTIEAVEHAIMEAEQQESSVLVINPFDLLPAVDALKNFKKPSANAPAMLAQIGRDCLQAVLNLEATLESLQQIVFAVPVSVPTAPFKAFAEAAIGGAHPYSKATIRPMRNENLNAVEVDAEDDEEAQVQEALRQSVEVDAEDDEEAQVQEALRQSMLESKADNSTISMVRKPESKRSSNSASSSAPSTPANAAASSAHSLQGRKPIINNFMASSSASSAPSNASALMSSLSSNAMSLAPASLAAPTNVTVSQSQPKEEAPSVAASSSSSASNPAPAATKDSQPLSTPSAAPAASSAPAPSKKGVVLDFSETMTRHAREQAASKTAGTKPNTARSAGQSKSVTPARKLLVRPPVNNPAAGSRPGTAAGRKPVASSASASNSAATAARTPVARSASSSSVAAAPAKRATSSVSTASKPAAAPAKKAAQAKK